MQQVKVDVEKRLAVLALEDRVAAPYLLEKGLRNPHIELSNRAWHSAAAT
jgi:hypothetical protein